MAEYAPRADSVAGKVQEDRRRALESYSKEQLIGTAMRVYTAEDEVSARDAANAKVVLALRTQNQELSTKNQELSSSASQAKSDMQSYKSSYEEGQKTITALNTKIEDLGKALNSLKDTNSTLQEQLSALQLQVADKDKMLTTLQAEVDTYKNAPPIVVPDTEYLRTQILALSSELLEANQRRAQLTDDVQVLSAKLQALGV